MVMLGEFPTGQRLAEEQLAVQLVRLHADRLLSRFDDGGYYVAEIDVLDLRDLYELRLVVELHGINRAADQGIVHDREALVDLRATWLAVRAAPPAPDGSFIEKDEQFHLALLRASGNVALVDVLESVNVRIRPVRTYDFLSEDRIRTSIDEHLAIVEAVLDGRIAEAAHLLRYHNRASLEIVEQRAADAMRRRALRSRSTGSHTAWEA